MSFLSVTSRLIASFWLTHSNRIVDPRTTSSAKKNCPTVKRLAPYCHYNAREVIDDYHGSKRIARRFVSQIGRDAGRCCFRWLFGAVRAQPCAFPEIRPNPSAWARLRAAAPAAASGFDINPSFGKSRNSRPPTRPWRALDTPGSGDPRGLPGRAKLHCLISFRHSALQVPLPENFLRGTSAYLYFRTCESRQTHRRHEFSPALLGWENPAQTQHLPRPYVSPYNGNQRPAV